MEEKRNKNKLKFNLLPLLRKLPVEDYEIAMSYMPEYLKVTERTWKRWIYLRHDEGFDLPFWAAIKISRFLNVEPFELYATQQTFEDEIKRSIQ